MSALFGVQPNADTRVGLYAVVSNITIKKGTATVVNDSFTKAELDPAVWLTRAQDPGGVVPTTPDLAYLVSWPLPDAGFSLRSSATLKAPWAAAGTPRQVGARRLVLVNKADLPSPGAGFFQLAK
jgi:hypothetical protein